MDKRAEFEKIVKQEMTYVFNVAYRLCGNFHQAGDITQETFLRTYQSFHRFEGRSKISTYLYRIACNVWKNTLRKKEYRTLLHTLSDPIQKKQTSLTLKNSSMDEDIRRTEKTGLSRDVLIPFRRQTGQSLC